MALQQASDLRKQIDTRKKEASGNTDALTALEEVEKKLEAAMEADSDAEFGLFGLAAPGKEHERLPKVVAALTRFLIVVDSSDLGPGADAAMASARWEEAAQETLAQWAALQKEDLANVNALLEKAKLKPLAVDESPVPH